MTEERYLRIYDMMRLVVITAKLYGGTWDELEQILHDNMKDCEVSSEQEVDD